MRALRALCAALVAALSIVVVGAGPSFACSCATADTAQHVDWADVVVAGTVVDVVPPRQKPIMSSMDPVTYVVDVDRVFRGEAGSRVEVLSPSSGASCGLENVEVGRRYVVFAAHQSVEGKDAEHLWASLCGGTDRARPDLVTAVELVTGEGVPPAPDSDADGSDLGLTFDPPAEPPLGAGWAWPLALVAGGGLVLLTGALWLRLRLV